MSKRINKIPQLDSLRAIAAFSVIIYHFLPEYELGKLPFGWIGVDLFFVISGYLITAILLEQKVSIGNKLLIVKNFIIKRALRLFPTYYLLISFFALLMFAFGFWVWNAGNGIYYYTYTQNILFFLEGMKGTQLNHLWTLAVEEQFYLFWPWVVIYINNKNLITITVIIIISSLLLKSFSEIENLRMLTFSHFDTLGSGALFALLLKEKKDSILLTLNKIKPFTISASLTILIFAVFFKTHIFITSVAILILANSLLIGSFYSFKNIFGQLLNVQKLNYLGQISYGLYLYHKPIPYLLKLIMGKLNLHVNNFILFTVSLILTTIIAHLSYIFIEKRFLKLKDKFDL